jgi:two-component system nitrate/nitrite response regulator NarL
MKKYHCENRTQLAMKVQGASMRLSPRQKQVPALVAKGSTNKEIALCLGIAEGSVKQYLYVLLQVLGMSNRTALAMWAMRNQEALS